ARDLLRAEDGEAANGVVRIAARPGTRSHEKNTDTNRDQDERKYEISCRSADEVERCQQQDETEDDRDRATDYRTARAEHREQPERDDGNRPPLPDDPRRIDIVAEIEKEQDA